MNDNQDQTEISSFENDENQDYKNDYFINCYSCSKLWPLNDSQVPEKLFKIAQSIVQSISAGKKIEISSWQEDSPIPCDHISNLIQDPIYNASQTKHCNECSLRDNLWICLTCGNIACGRRNFDNTGGNGHAQDHYNQTKHDVVMKLGTLNLVSPSPSPPSLLSLDSSNQREAPTSKEALADVYCYECDQMRMDSNLLNHLTLLGIDIKNTIKTEKTIGELQLEQNLKFDFSMKSSDGQMFPLVTGSKLLFLKNLGNSCYMSSILQLIIPIMEMEQFPKAESHLSKCRRDAPSCFDCQIIKMINAYKVGSNKKQDLKGGEEGERENYNCQYFPSFPSCNSLDSLPSIRAWMLKSVIGSGHAEFSSFRQQDASEYLTFFLKALQRSDPHDSISFLDKFNISIQQSLVCDCCERLALQTITSSQLHLNLAGALINSKDPNEVNLLACIECMFEPETVEILCPRCSGKTSKKTLQIIKLPEYLFMSITKFTIQNWIPQKLDYPIEIPEILELTQQIPIKMMEIENGNKLSIEMEMEIKRNDNDNQNVKNMINDHHSMINQDALDQLMAMGFSERRSKRALGETGNINAEIAMNAYLLLHLDDQSDDLEEEMGESNQEINNKNKKNRNEMIVPPDLVAILTDAGFTKEQSIRALESTENNIERAFDWILSHDHPSSPSFLSDNPQTFPSPHSDYKNNKNNNQKEKIEEIKTFKYELIGFASHRGSSMQCGHYIAHRWDSDRKCWLMCNDEKIVSIEDKNTLFDHAKDGYIYLYKRIEIKEQISE